MISIRMLKKSLSLAAALCALGAVSGAIAQAKSEVLWGSPGGKALTGHVASKLEPEATKRWPESFAGLWIAPKEEGRPIYIAFTEDA